MHVPNFFVCVRACVCQFIQNALVNVLYSFLLLLDHYLLIVYKGNVEVFILSLTNSESK